MVSIVDADDVSCVTVIGAGTMGHGIAHVMAQAGIETLLVDVDLARADAGREAVRKDLDKGVELGKVDASVRDATLANLTAMADLEAAAARSQIIIEAVPEVLDLKQDMFRRVDAVAPEGAILASNTSSLSIAKIAEATSRPAAVAGMHFFNPVPRMQLLEIIHHTGTDPRTVETLKRIGERVGKTSIVVRDSPGFATSRLGIILGNEAMRMVEEGVASPEDIDTAMELGYRHPMGPLRLSDLVGLDVRLHISDYLERELGSPAYAAPPLLRKMVAEGKLGKKSGEGFYRYD